MPISSPEGTSGGIVSETPRATTLQARFDAEWRERNYDHVEAMNLAEAHADEAMALAAELERELSTGQTAALEQARRAIEDACHAAAIYGDEPPQLYRDALTAIDRALAGGTTK